MPMTMAEKILSAHSKKELQAGDIAICDIDFCFSQDGTSSLVIDSFKKIALKSPIIKDRFAMVIDHSAPSPNMGVSAVHKKMREFASEHGSILYDVGCGVCHHVIPEQGHVVPGDLVLGADSHTCTYGALGCFSTGVGSTDLAVALATGKNWFKVPESVKIILEGNLPKGVYSKDVILHIAGNLGADGCTYQSIEFEGPAINKMSIEARFTIANMAVELGAECAIMQADDKVLKWVESHTKRKPNPVFPDKDARYIQEYVYNVEKISPQISKPHSVDNVSGIEEVEGTPVHLAYLGTCTNGRLEDLAIAAGILKNKKISTKVRFIVAPASREVYLEAIKNGIIQILVQAGAAMVTPGCGPCVGTHNGIPSENENVISTANRNFKGRMGNPNAYIYLASPATVAASAITGKIEDPRKFL
jgi:3-isopropylmalate/(R)-2-methylmalate dehydratase large subunit